MADEGVVSQNETAGKTTVLIDERKNPKKKGVFTSRIVLIYVLVLASGLFLGILFGYLF